MKYCYRCDTHKLPEEFFKDSSRKDGLENRCKTCTIEVRKRYKRKQYPDTRPYEERCKAKDTGDNIYYVYLHKEGDSIVYVGKGKGGRVLEVNGRVPKHYQWMMDKLSTEPSLDSWVEFAGQSLGNREAHLLEAQIITEVKDNNPDLFNIKIKENGYVGRRKEAPRKAKESSSRVTLRNHCNV